jgi:methyltransferase (TIGR00027 family)
VIGTANWIAAVRARETRRPDRLFADPFAEALAGERGVAAMERSERASGGENPFIPVRVRWFDDAVLAAAAAGVRQIVLLGAGLDTRPYRLDLPSDLDWFEVDLTFDGKERVLAGATARCRRHTVVADVTGDWRTPLEAAGLHTDRRTLWLAEGLFFYLAQETVSAVLRDSAAACPPGSLFLADVLSATGLSVPAMRAYRDYCQRQNLPPPFGSDDPAALLAEAGWRPERITYAGDPSANFGRLPTAGGRHRPAFVTGSRAEPA